MGQCYTDLLADIDGLQLPEAQTAYAENVYWVYGLVLGPEYNTDAAAVIGQLADRGIGTRPFFWPMHEQPVLKNLGFFKGETYPVAERLARRGFYIPSGLGLNQQQIESISSICHEVLV